MDKAKAATYARQKAQPASTARCAQAVRLAMMEGGGLALTGWPGHALHYHTQGYLKANGFEEVAAARPGHPPPAYVPQVGDICVSEAPPGVPLRDSGHIAIYDGSVWVSDFVQRSHLGNSAWVGKVPCWFYRYP